MEARRRPSLTPGSPSLLRPVILILSALVIISFATSKAPTHALPRWTRHYDPRRYMSQLRSARPYTGEHAGLSLSKFLQRHIGPPRGTSEGRGVWVSLADEGYIRESLSHTRLYLDDLPSRPAFPHHDLVVLCMDAGCVEEGRRRHMLAYGGFMHDNTRPDFVRNDTWAKAQGLAQILEAGYHVLFFDGDVLFRSDVFEHLNSLDQDTWDLQIQDEVHNANVNTGFMFMRSNQKTAALWRHVADQVTEVGLRDQAKVNAYLQTTDKRTQTDGTRADSLVGGPYDLRVRVLPTESFWGMHLAWFVPTQTSILHITCAPRFLKSYIAGTHGLWQDVEGFYSKPPRMLSLGTGLGGSPENVKAMFGLLMATAMSTQRAMLPPLNGHVLGPSNENDGNLGDPNVNVNITHSRLLWSLVDLEPLLASEAPVRLLEPNYPEHATKWLSGDHRTLLDLHMVRELDLRPINHFKELLRKLNEPTYRDARHVRLITDEGPQGFRSLWGGWRVDYPSAMPEIRACAQPERISACGDLCR